MFGRGSKSRSAEPTRADKHQAYQRALVSEVRMMIDHLAAQPTRSLREVKPRDCEPGGKAGDMDPCVMLQRVDEFDTALADGVALTSAQCATLQLIRDALAEAVRPATGMTIAFTAMVAGHRRGHDSQSRWTMAQEAYAGLHDAAVRLRYWYLALIAFAVVVTAMASWQATKVALGKSLMQRLESLRIEQKALEAEKARLTGEIDRGSGKTDTLALFVNGDIGDASGRVRSFGLCDRPIANAWELLHAGTSGTIPSHPVEPLSLVARAGAAFIPGLAYLGGEKLKLYNSAGERDVCEHDHVLGYSFRLMHYDLERYREDWPTMAGAYYAQTSTVLDGAGDLLRMVGGFLERVAYCPTRHGHRAEDGPKIGFWRCLVTADAMPPPPAPTLPAQPPGDDVEFIIAPKLVVWGNYVLPVIFGVLGAAIYAILDLYGRMRESRLDPRDLTLSMMRLVLGLVTGACVGLFFSTYGPTGPNQATNLIETLTLSASGLAFLAGFGVEGVFTLLQSLITRVFPAAETGRR